MHGHDAIMSKLYLELVFKLEYDFVGVELGIKGRWLYKRWLSESNQVMALFIACIIVVWDPLYADCVSLIYKIGNAKLNTINGICLTFE